jgi:hypothetical protein
MPTVFFPCVLIFLNLCAAIAYGVHADFRMMLYWLAAALLTTCVTFQW